MTPARWIRKALGSLLLLILGIAAGWAALETGGRYFTRERERSLLVSPNLTWTRWNRYDPDLMWALLPNVVNGEQSLQFSGKTRSWTFSTNAEGLRQGPLGPKGDRRRILCVGDSRTFGLGVDDGATWPAQLQQALDARHPGRFEVVNAGVSGYTARQGLRFLELRADALRPDMVIAAFAFNEAAQIPPPGIGDWEWENFRQMSGARALLKRAAYGAGLERPAPSAHHDTRLSPGQTLDTLIALGRFCTERKIAPVLLFWPALPELVDEKFVQQNISGLSIEAARLGSSSLVDVSPVLREHMESIFLDPIHLNEAGNRLVAENVAAALLEMGAPDAFSGNADGVKTAQPLFNTPSDREGRIDRLIQWVKSDPGCFMPYGYINDLVLAKNDREFTVQTWRRVTEASPQSWRGWDQLARGLQQLGLEGDALNAYRSALSLSPEDPWVYQNAGVLMARLAPTEAIPVLRTALSMKGDLPDVRPVLLRLLLDAGQRDEAGALADEWRQRGGSIPEALQKQLERP
jgi:lysophospholipase L1-like esterase